MNMTTNINREFGSGSDPDLLMLVQRVRGFDHDNATPDEQRLVVQALKTIAEDTLARFDRAAALQQELEHKLATATFCEEVSQVVAVLKPVTTKITPRRRLWGV